MCKVFDSKTDLFSRSISAFTAPGKPHELQSLNNVRYPADPTAPLLILNPPKNLELHLAHEGYTHCHSFLVLPSRKSPRWLLPLGNPFWTLVGTKIYTPSAPIARTMKHVLTRVIRTGWNGWARHRVLVASKEPLPLEVLVSEITGERNPIFALSLGNQPAVRKLTVQVMRPDGDILGYVKLPLTDRAAGRVRHEGMILERLWNSPPLRTHIPRLLHAGVWGESYALFQTAVPGTLGPPTITRMHDEFLRVLWNVHRVDKPVRVLIEEIGAKWEKAALRLSDKWKALGQEVLRCSARDSDQPTIPCGVTHGDFAPWNTRVHQERLLLFDWESTNWEAPMSWDTFHFNLQTAVSLKKRIGSTFNSDHKSNRGTPYFLYLLSSVIQFLQEENWAAIDLRQQLLLRQFDETLDVPSDIRFSRKPAVQFPEVQLGREAHHAAIQSISKRESNPRIVTTSWDDGDPHDIKVAELLRARDLRGTFYIPMSGYLGRKTLAPANVRSFASEGFEIGAHSVSHNSLTHLTRQHLEHEVNTCKRILEQQIGREVSMFCYPNGRYNQDVIRQVKHAGYQGARTTRMLTLTMRFDAFEMPTTLHVHPHAKFAYVRNLARARSLGGLCEFLGRFSRVDNWVRLGKSLFDLVAQEGGVWHLYGHSWLIEELKMWSELREMLDYVANREGVTYATNGQLVQMMTPTRIALATEADCEIARI